MLERRNKGQRRWGLDGEFPLKDSGGVTVITERRRMSDRRVLPSLPNDAACLTAAL